MSLIREIAAPAEASSNRGYEPRPQDIWQEDAEVLSALRRAEDAETARSSILAILDGREAALHQADCRLHALERSNALHCIRVVRNFMSPRNERVSGVSVIKNMFDSANATGSKVHPSFVIDIVHILKGTTGQTVLDLQEAPDFSIMGEREGSRSRSDHLDGLAETIQQWTKRYPSGLEPWVRERRIGNRNRIIEYLGAREEDWNDHAWQMRNVMVSSEVIGDLIELTEEEREAISLCVENGIPFGITPYYLSLMDRDPSRTFDHAVRAQVIPPLSYVRAMIRFKTDPTVDLDFMRECHTMPIDLVTRRYPQIAIFKPYNTCAQICVYCQRNWEIEGVLSEKAMAPPDKIEAAIQWFSEHPAISEVLVTGGDPAVLPNTHLRKILSRLSEIPHIRRIRLGTRVPVVMPMRIDEGFLDVLKEVHDPPRREFALVTHFEHPYEVTPETAESVLSVKALGVSVYNQQVFTMENCRRFETVALRSWLKEIGVDPYYTFNAKGKEETSEYRVPIARLLQERKEEARMLPGLSRTDEPVFNIPALGKNHLRAWQHHDLIAITPRGERVYEFHPWEKNIAVAPTYVYRDVPIADFLDALAKRGEDVENYRSIWYYF